MGIEIAASLLAIIGVLTALLPSISVLIKENKKLELNLNKKRYLQNQLIAEVKILQQERGSSGRSSLEKLFEQLGELKEIVRVQRRSDPSQLELLEVIEILLKLIENNPGFSILPESDSAKILIIYLDQVKALEIKRFQFDVDVNLLLELLKKHYKSRVRELDINLPQNIKRRQMEELE